MEMQVAILKRHLFSKPSSQLSRDEVLAALTDILGYVKNVPMVQKATFPATLEGRVERTHAHSSVDKSTKERGSGGNGPLIKEIIRKELNLSLWPSVLPWETTRGLSLVPSNVIRGCHGKERTDAHISASRLESTEESTSRESYHGHGDDDSLAFVTKRDSTVHRLNNMGAYLFPPNTAANTDEGANGMLFVHRGSDLPEYWSGGIQDSIDVAFLSLSTPTDVRIIEEGGYGGLEEARTGLISNSPYQSLDRSYHRTGYGPLDDPGMYSFFLKQSCSNSSSNMKGAMALTVEDISHLDPFLALKHEEATLSEGSTAVHLFDGCHDMEDGVGSHRCRPFDNSDYLSVKRNVNPLITSILEVRRGLFRSFTSSFFQNNDAAEAKQRDDDIQFFLHPSVALLKEMQAKEYLYQDIITTLDDITSELLDTCNKPVATTANGTQNDTNPSRRATPLVRPMEAWREGSSDGVSSISELMDGAPKTKAPSFHGIDGTKRSSDFVNSARYPRSNPSMPTYPPVDIELFAASFQLGMCHSVMVRVMERIAIDLKYDHRHYQPPLHIARGVSFSEPCEPSLSFPRVSDIDIRRLASLVRDPSISIFIPEVIYYTMKEAERRGLVL